VLNISEEDVRAFVFEAHQAGLQIGMHAIGDHAVDIVVRAYADAIDRWPRDDARHRIEHFHAPTEWAIAEARRLHLALPMQPIFSYLWDRPPDDHYIRLWGEERTNRCEPFQRLCGLGMMVSGGSDSPVTPIDPLLGIHSAANNPNPTRRTTMAEALRLFTINGAWTGYEEHDKGTIEPGKLADLTAIDLDPYAHPDRVKEANVGLTVVGGRIVHADP
jgi:predicted amidohydrolase YtcJ